MHDPHSRDALRRTVSVVIPSRDGRETIERALRSLVPGAPFIREVIVVFSNSPVGYREQCAALVAAYREFFPLLLLDSGPDSNGSIARNTGIDASSGSYVAFLDDDDAWLSDKLPSYFEFIAARGLRGDFVVFSTVVACGEDHTDATLFPLEPYAGERIADFVLSTRGGAQTSALLLPAVLAKRVKFDASLRRHQDYDFCVRLEEAGATFHHLDRPFSYWYKRGTGLGKGATFEYCADWITANQRRVSRRAYVAYLEKELLAAARATGRYADFVKFVRTHLSWSEQITTFARLIERAARKALRDAWRRGAKPSSADLLHGHAGTGARSVERG
jgi:glycosyltransferase involved in cell wall biosynthesis